MESYEKKLKGRLLAYRLLFAALLAAMVVVGELSHRGVLLDSRGMTALAQDVSRLLLFGGMIATGVLIHRTKGLLDDRLARARRRTMEEDERRRFIRDRSGAVALDAFLAIGVAAVFVLSYVNMTAFNTALGLLAAALLLRGAAYLYCARLF